eukprot:Amastigsp_a844606_19.p2 type:complete len:120 gc:universal Amastigsp_a844606_19:208-567(+)
MPRPSMPRSARRASRRRKRFAAVISLRMCSAKRLSSRRRSNARRRVLAQALAPRALGRLVLGLRREGAGLKKTSPRKAQRARIFCSFRTRSSKTRTVGSMSSQSQSRGKRNWGRRSIAS